MKQMLFTLSCAAALSAAPITNLPAANTPPGGIAAADAPLFICFGWDDNAYPDAVDWIREFTDTLKNRDGSPVRMTFFNSGGYGTSEKTVSGIDPKAVITAWQNLYKRGHEIGNHTWSHFHGAGGEGGKNFDQAGWENEMKMTNDLFGKEVGVPAAEITGFRTPYLEFNGETHPAVKSQKFVYDCSIEWGYNGGFQMGDKYLNALNPQTYANLFWPYTLENPHPSGMSAKAATASSVPGLWEVPVYAMLSPDSTCQLTGFDYNIWSGEKKVPEFDEKGYADFYKWHIDLHRKGNRAPFCLNLHTDYYSQKNSAFQAGLTKTDYLKRRKAIEDIVKYAIQFEEVRVVPFITMISWMQNPVKSSEYKAPTKAGTGTVSIQPGVKPLRPFTACISDKSVTITIPVSGVSTVKLLSASGKLCGELCSGMLTAGEKTVSLENIKLSSGVYFVQIEGAVQAAAKIVLK